MPSLTHGFEYDIFISYRHNDNQSGWVTDFVSALQEELASTIKESVSIYFDKSPHDGLLETHNVDKSLEGKLKCLIFIPILSQTYCDPKSFAWQCEFCAFNKLAIAGEVVRSFGRDIKLSNGNVASRILPIKIHELDVEDKTVIEKELGGVLRAIEFIYKESGVNRPLKSSDNKNENQNKSDYRNQVNKVANAIKEIISSLKNPSTKTSQNAINHIPIVNLKQSGQSAPPKWKNKILVASIIVLLLLIISGYYAIHSLKKESSLPIDKSIAVLPFENLNKDPEQEYFSDGITLDLISQLSKINDLRVISRASVMRYKGNQKDFKEIAGELNVTTLLQGVVRQSGNTIRISANLINAYTGEQLWSEVYDRELKDIFEIQSSVSREIANALKAELSPLQQASLEKKPTQNMEAYQLYLHGKFHWSKLKKDEMAKALESYKQAIEKDPDFALAYVGLAETYSLIAFFEMKSILPPREAMLNAKAAVLKAIALDNTLAEAYISMGYILRTYDWDWNAAEASFKKGIALNGNLAAGHDSYAGLLVCLGRFEEAMIESQKAVNLDPLSYVTNLDASRMLRYSGKFKESMVIAQRTLELDPNGYYVHELIGTLLELMGDKESAVAEFVKDRGDRATSEIKNARTYDQFCRADLQESLLDSLNIPASYVAKKYMRLGNHEKAIQYLQRAHKNREGNLVYINVEPLYKPLHHDKRFKNLVEAMGLQSTD